jgi:hypothetical protein
LILKTLSGKVARKEKRRVPGSCPITIRGVRFLLLVFLFFGTVMSNPREAISADSSAESLITCDIQKGPCTEQLGGLTVTLDILPKPVMAMKDLKFQVTLSGEKKTGIPYIDLGMPGMNMGPNRVELRRVKDNLFEGQGVIVRCPSGRRTWRATVTLPQTGKVEFVFDVVY